MIRVAMYQQKLMLSPCSCAALVFVVPFSLLAFLCAFIAHLAVKGAERGSGALRLPMHVLSAATLAIWWG